MSENDAGSELTDEPSPEERQLQAKLDAGSITEAEYARLTALRFGLDPDGFSADDATEFYGLTRDEFRAEIAWLSGDSES